MRISKTVNKDPAWLHVLAGLLVVSFVSAGSSELWEGRAELLSQSQETVTNLELAIREDLLHTFDFYDASMRATAARSLKSEVRALPPEIRQDALFDLTTSSHEMGRTLILDVDGKVEFDSQVADPPHHDLSREEYFTLQRDHTNVGMYVAKPEFNIRQNEWFIALSRRIENTNGTFAGVVVATIRVSYLQNLFDKLTIGKHGTVFLLRTDGVLLARTSESLAVIGDNISSGMIFRHILKTPNEFYTAASPHFGSWKSYTHNKLQGFPLFLSVAIDISGPYFAWLKKSAITATIVLVLILAVIVLMLLWRNRERDLRVQFLRFRTALNKMPQGLCMFDANRKLVISNDRYRDLYQIAEDLLVPGTPLRVMAEERSRRRPLSQESGVDYFKDRIAAIEENTSSTRIYHYAGGLVISVTHEVIEGGGWVSTHEDITERTRFEEKITHLANHDSLTELANRANMRRALDTALADRLKPELAILYLDLDGFKLVNDSYGHAVGDAFLQEATKRLRASVRAGDLVARIGGDEFAILVRDPTPQLSASALAQRILHRFEEPTTVGDHSSMVGISIGIALAPENGVDADALFRCADLALYQAKSDGRGTARFFKPDANARMTERMGLAADLRTAVANQELELSFQPIVDLQTGEPNCFEALVRWRHPVRGVVSPLDFIPIAEETGLILPIGEWVLREACAVARHWPDHVRIAINISALQIRENMIADLVETTCRECGISPHRLELEMTESVFIRDANGAQKALNRLRALGVRTALDDFGTGYSSLSYLRTFSCDKLKIDKSFIADLREGDDSSIIVRAIIGLGKSLSLEVTAEGIESVEQLRVLLQEGCGSGQGYLFAKPMPKGAIAAYLVSLAQTRPQAA